MPNKLLLAALLVLPIWANPLYGAEDRLISDKDSFLAAVNGRDLTIGLFDLSLTVLPDGTLTGTAMGWDVKGTWTWEDGLFCREMDWSGYKIDYDCQTVEQRGEKLRFTAKRGQGRAADFRLK
jgi:hypothetical protein